MFNVTVTDINENNYNFNCDYFTESFDNNNKRQELTLYTNRNVSNSFVENYVSLDGIQIKTILIADANDEELIIYEKYSKLATAIVTCREGTVDGPEIEPKESIFQGVATFRK